MERSEAQEWLKRALAERDAAHVALDRARATLESSELIIRGILRAHPDLSAQVRDLDTFAADGQPQERPRGSEAVLSVLQVNENYWMRIVDLVNALSEQDMLPDSANPANAVRTAVERLVSTEGSNVHKGKDRSGTVIYRYYEPEAPEGPPGGDTYYDEEPF